MRHRTVAVLLLALGLTLPGTVVSDVGANEQPLADGGLDQTVTLGDTVLLDAGGSRDPDGSIVSHEWRIVAPNGSTVPPACPSCERTRFVPTTTGVYEVELTVTDDDGASSTDRLTVTVESAGGPSVSLVGPRTAEVGNATRYRATADAGDARLSELVWRVNGSVVRRVDVAGRHARENLQWPFTSPGRHDVSVTVVDEDGETASDSIDVSVTSPSNDPPSVSISGPDRVVQGRWADFTADASDLDGSVVDYSWSNVGPTPARDRARRKFDESVGSLVTVSVTVEDDDGAPATAYKTVEVVGSEDQVSVAGTNASTATSTPTETSTDPVSTPNPETTETASEAENVASPPEVTDLQMETNRGSEYQKSTSTISDSGVNENEDTITFTVTADPGTMEQGDALTFKFDFGDGTTKTAQGWVSSTDSTTTVEMTHDFASIDDETTRTVTVTVIGDNNLENQESETITFRPSNEDVQNKVQYGVEVTGPDTVETGSPAIFEVGDVNGSVRAPPRVVVEFGDGSKRKFDPDDTGTFSTTASHIYDTRGTHTVTARVKGHSSNGQASNGGHSIEVTAATYTVYEWNSKDSENHRKTTTSVDKPGPSWDYVKTVGSVEESTGDTITVPESMSEPRATMSGYRWKSTGTRYDPVMDTYMESFEKYEVEDEVKWEKTWTTSEKGDLRETLDEPPSWKVYGNTLEKKTYKCTNDNAPEQGRACTDQNGNEAT